MQFITTGNRIAVENFEIGYFYTITMLSGNYFQACCTGIGSDFVMFSRDEPDLLFSLTMQSAADVSSIELYDGGTDDYNDLTNKPQINSITLTGNKSLSDLGIQGTISDLDIIRSGAAAGATAVQPAAMSAALAAKQDTLSSAQLAAVNSGIDSTKVAQIETNKNNISLFDRQVNNAYKTIDIATNMTFLSTGYIKSNGDIGTSNNNAVYYMTLGKIRELAFDFNTVLTSGTGLAKLTDSEGTLKKVYINKKTAKQTIKIENGQPTDVLYITFYDYQSSPTTYYSTFGVKDYTAITTSYYDELEEMISQSPVYYNTVSKSLDFTSKKLQFFGDSITYGYISSGNRANPTYPDAFGAHVNASSIINSAVSDSTIAVVDEHTSIYTAIQNNLDTTADFVFIAGGINDWQLGVNDTTLRTAMQNICTYLTNNYTGTVIFITPINHGGKTPTTTPTQTLDSVRRCITEIALTNGYNVVQGWQFPFPNQGANADYISTMYADLLHPTQTGYNIYAKALECALC